jgi:transcriptional regulator with XRE-family HTH domain
MTLGEKLRSLRAVEGALRGFDRPMTQPEVVRAMKKEVGRTVSQSYFSQIEGGVRPHITQTTRDLLAKFFRVYPGFLVDDPEGYHPALISDLRVREDRLESWLEAAAQRFHGDPEFVAALELIAKQRDPRREVLLLAEILRHPGMADHLAEILLAPEGLKPKGGRRGANGRKQ